MNKFFVVLAFGALLSGCNTVTKMTPEQQVNLINAFSNAGCKGRVHAEAGGETGQLGGGAHAGVTVDGSCDPADRPVLRNTVIAAPPPVI